MKTIAGFLEALRLTPVFVGSFGSKEDVFSFFEREMDSDIQIVYANYENESYDGYATVVFYRESTGKYYESYGSHCSCYGLEGQWDREEEVIPEELLKRISDLGQMFDEYVV